MRKKIIVPVQKQFSWDWFYCVDCKLKDCVWSGCPSQDLLGAALGGLTFAGKMGDQERDEPLQGQVT